jgi:hypothetical protein
MAEITREEEIGTKALEGQGFSIHFDADPQELNHLFQARFFNLIGQGVVQPRPERPPFQPCMSLVSQFPLMSHYNLKSLKMMDGKIFFTQE